MPLRCGAAAFFPGKLCIEVEAKSKIAFISEELCIGCGICVKVRRRHPRLLAVQRHRNF